MATLVFSLKETPTELGKKATKSLQNIWKTTMTARAFQTELTGRIVEDVVKHVNTQQGPNGLWRSHSDSTVLARKAKRVARSEGGYNHKGVPASSPRAFFASKSQLVSDLRTKTTFNFKILSDKNFNLEIFFDSNRVAGDVSYGRTHPTSIITELQLAHRKITLQRKQITAKHAKALMIPTPGQIEQVYLGQYHNTKKTFFSVSQQDVQLANDVKIAEKTSGVSRVCNVTASVKAFMDALFS